MRKFVLPGGLVLGLVLVSLVVIGLVVGRGRATRIAPTTPGVQVAVTPGATPVSGAVATGCTPPGSIRCQELAARAQAPTPQPTFDWGQVPKIDLGRLGSSILIPTPALPVSPRISRLPGIRAVWGGFFTIFHAFEWIIRNIWIILIVAVVMGFLFRMPVWAPFVMLWELGQTLFSKTKTVDDVINTHRAEFHRPGRKQREQKGSQGSQGGQGAKEQRAANRRQEQKGGEE